MTNEQFVAEAQAVINQWEQRGYNPPNLARTEHNANCVLGGIYDFAVANKKMPTAEEVRDVVIKNRKDLEYIRLEPAPADPKTTIPHQDKFPKINSIEKAIRYVKTAKIPGDQLNAINELLEYLQIHDIHEWDVVAADNSTPGEAPEGGEIAQARTLVNNLKISDIGTTTSASGGGRWSQLIKLQDRLNKVIDSAKLRRATGVLKYVQDEIAKLGDRGIK